jgi:hypothetical protein
MKEMGGKNEKEGYSPLPTPARMVLEKYLANATA